MLSSGCISSVWIMYFQAHISGPLTKSLGAGLVTLPHAMSTISATSSDLWPYPSMPLDQEKSTSHPLQQNIRRSFFWNFFWRNFSRVEGLWGVSGDMRLAGWSSAAEIDGYNCRKTWQRLHWTPATLTETQVNVKTDEMVNVVVIVIGAVLSVCAVGCIAQDIVERKKAARNEEMVGDNYFMRRSVVPDERREHVRRMWREGAGSDIRPRPQVLMIEQWW